MGSSGVPVGSDASSTYTFRTHGLLVAPPNRCPKELAGPTEWGVSSPLVLGRVLREVRGNLADHGLDGLGRVDPDPPIEFGGLRVDAFRRVSAVRRVSLAVPLDAEVQRSLQGEDVMRKVESRDKVRDLGPPVEVSVEDHGRPPVEEGSGALGGQIARPVEAPFRVMPRFFVPLLYARLIENPIDGDILGPDDLREPFREGGLADPQRPPDDDIVTHAYIGVCGRV